MIVLSTLIAAAYLWSIALFVVALLNRDRHQEAGFGYALWGAIAYFVCCCDTIAGHPDSIRRLLLILPGANSDNIYFNSPLWLPIVLAIIYALRIVIFIRVFNTLQDLNDAIIELPTFLTALLPSAAIVVGLYGLGTLPLIAIIAGGIILFLIGAFDQLLGAVEAVYRLIDLAMRKTYRALRHFPTLLLIALAKVALVRKTLGISLDSLNSRLQKMKDDEINATSHDRTSDERRLQGIEDSLRDSRRRRKPKGR